MRKTIKIILGFFLILLTIFANAQAPFNDNCNTAEFIILNESGNACLNSNNINATSDGVFNSCDAGAINPLPPGGHEIWYSYVSSGIENSITITPIGATAAQQVSITVTNGNCTMGGTTICNTAVNPNDPASVFFTKVPGSQVWFYVTSLIADGDFLVCVNSVAGPINPGNNCGNATRLCNKLDFSSPGIGFSSFASTPSCFNSPPVRPMWYKFTTGNSGPIEFAGFPTGFGGFRWAMYDITLGCPGIEVACNNYYDPFQPFGFSSSVINCTSNPFCPLANVTAGSTYALMIDDTSQTNSGFDFNWSTNIKLLPTAEFTVDSLIGCGSLTVDFTDKSIYNSTTTFFLDYGDGSPTFTGNGSSFNLPSHTYNPGTYLIQLTLNQPGSCNNSFARQIIVYPKPTSTFSISNDTLCLPNGNSVSVNLKSSYISSTANYNWNNANSSVVFSNGIGDNNVSWNTAGVKAISLSISENGCNSDTTRDTIFVFNTPTATFNLIDSACNDGIINVLYNGNALATASYVWTYGGANTSNVSNQSFDASWNLPGKKFISLKVSDYGCTSPLNIDSIIISQTPSITINSFTRVCQGDTITFNPISNASEPVVYTWDFGSSTYLSGNISDGSAGELTWNIPGLTYWTATAISNAGCISNKDSISFTVYPKPVATYLLNKNKLCGADSSILTFSGSAATSAIYNFSNGGSLANGILPNALTLTFPGGPTTYPIYLSIIDNLCISDTVKDTIIVYPIPIADAGIDTSLCSNDVISIGSTQINNQTYSWSPTFYLSGNTLSNPQTSILNFGSTDSISRYIVIATSGVCSINDTIYITTHPRQASTFNPPIRQCLNENNFTFQPASLIVNGTKFDWSFGTNSLPDSAHSAIVSNVHFNNTGWQPVTLKTQSLGCASNIYMDSVFIKTSPIVSIDANAFTGCVPLPVKFSNLSSLYPNSTLYWDFDDGNSSTVSNPTNEYISAGIYQPTLKIITQDTCSSTDSLSHAIIITSLPNGIFTVYPTLIYDTYPNINFNYSESNVKCLFDFGDGNNDTICNGIHAYADTGEYKITLITINNNGCSDTSYEYIYVKTFYSLYIPNAFTPNDDFINDELKFLSNGVAEFEITIYNRFGQSVFTSDNKNSSWDGNNKDNHTRCPQGIYLYNVKTTDTNKKKHSFTGKVTLIR